MTLVKDMTGPCDSPPRSENESQDDSKMECLDRYYSSDMDTARVVRDNGRVIVKFGEEYEDIQKISTASHILTFFDIHHHVVHRVFRRDPSNVC